MVESETERAAFNAAVVEALEGLRVVVKGNVLGDEMSLELARDGAQAVVDRLKARDFKLIRA